MLCPLALLYLCCLEPLFALPDLFTEFAFAIPRYFFINIVQSWMVEAPVFVLMLLVFVTLPALSFLAVTDVKLMLLVILPCPPYISSVPVLKVSFD